MTAIARALAGHYDVVVAGGTLAATIAAALLSERRYRGLLVDQGELSAAQAPLLVDHVCPDEGSPAMQLVHAELHLKDRLARQLRPLSPTVQVVLQDERLDLPRDPQGAIAEVRRALGAGAADALSRLMARLPELETDSGLYLEQAGPLPASGFFARRRAALALRRHPRVGAPVEDLLEGAGDELRELLVAAIPFSTHLDARSAADLTAARFVRPIARLFRGLGVLEDDRTLREVFEDHARRGGFEVVHGAVERIEPVGTMLRVTIADAGGSVNAGLVIDASADLSALAAVPLARRRRQKMASTLDAGRPQGSLHALQIEVDRSVLPPGLADRVLLLNGRRAVRAPDAGEPEDRPILLLVRPAPRSDARARLVALHPLSAAEQHANDREALDRAIRARIERLVPFLDGGHPVEERPRVNHPLFDPELDPDAGIAGIPQSTPIKNLLVAGPAVLPGLGVEGAYLAALQAADAVDRVARKQRRPKSLAARLAPAAS